MSRVRSLAPLLPLLLLGAVLALSLPCASSAEKIADCCCELETIDGGNDQALYDTLSKLRVSAKASTE